ncbi:hypothetical protein MJN76_29400, partial [Salmonella enterica subsp. enterica serovar Anatum]|nr:hypothetical protein [Salmonella enterica subsp. enterica serovar Anatum]
MADGASATYQEGSRNSPSSQAVLPYKPGAVHHRASSSSRAITESPVVVALDYHERDKALAFVDKIDPRDCRLKVG